MTTPEESGRCTARRFGLRPTRLAVQRVIEDLHHVPGHQQIPELHNGGKGQLKAVAQFTQKRSTALPNVPTAVEAGIPVLMSSERGFAAPKDVDPAIAKRLEQAIQDALKDPEFLAVATADAAVLSFMPGEQWAKSMERSTSSLKKLAGARR